MITFPANPHSAPCCRLDISLLSARHQGAERHRSASKVTEQTFEVRGHQSKARKNKKMTISLVLCSLIRVFASK
jgi:hypothetical protein